MKYTHEIKKLPKSELEITVTISHDELKPFLEQAAQNLSQQSKIEGFRPGKAPLEIVKQRVGEMKLYEEAGALAMQKSYLEIASNEKLEPLGSPNVDFVKLAPDNDFTYKAVVALVPKITLCDWKKIKVKEKTIEITDEQIEKTLQELQNSRAQEVLEDKEIAKTDKVEIDFDVFRDNVPIEGGEQKKYPLIIGSEHFIPGFEDNLIGLKKDGEKEFELSFPKEYHNKNLAGKPAKFKVKVLAVYKRTLPKLDDEFAKSLGQESFDKLKEQIKHNLEHEAHHKEEERVELELLEKIIDKSEFGDLPDSLMDAESNQMVQELEQNIGMQGIKFEDYLLHLNKTREQLKLDFVPQAVKRVRGALVSRQVYFDEKIEIPDTEVDQEIEQAKKMYQNNPEVAKNLDTPQYREYVTNMVGNRKVMELIKTTCVERDNKNKEIKHDH
ncbi:trigger factor [Patescibacteria group bacterium]